VTPEQRLDRTERILMLMITAGRRARTEWNEKVNILIDAQIRHEAAWRAESQAVNEQIKAIAVAQAGLTNAHKLMAVAQAELTESQKLTDQALRAFINSLRKRGNGNSST